MGESVLVSPVLTPDTSEIEAYFTGGVWYSAWDYQKLDAGAGGKVVQLTVPLGDIGVHYRGGSIIPLQQYAAVTRDVRYNPVTLIVALPSAPAAESKSLPPYIHEEVCNAAHSSNPGSLVSCGVLFMDSVEDVTVISAVNSVQVWFTAVTAADGRSGTIKSTVVSNAGNASGKIVIEAVHILGVQPFHTAVTAAVGDDSALPALEASFDAPLEETDAMSYGRKLPESAAAAVSIRVGDKATMSSIPGVEYADRVLRISGMTVDVGASMQMSWSI